MTSPSAVVCCLKKWKENEGREARAPLFDRELPSEGGRHHCDDEQQEDRVGILWYRNWLANRELLPFVSCGVV